MKSSHLNKFVIASAVLLAAFSFGYSQKPARAIKPAAIAGRAASSQIKERDVRAHMNFLASDALQGRGSGTQFELLAGEYIGSQLQQFGVEPAGVSDTAGNTGYIQTVNITRNSFVRNPSATFMASGRKINFEYGDEMVVLRTNKAQSSGPLQRITLDQKPNPGAVVLVKNAPGDSSEMNMQKLQPLLKSGAAAIIVEETARWRNQWRTLADRKVSFTTTSADKPDSSPTIIVISNEAENSLIGAPDGTVIEITGQLAPPQIQHTYNAVGKLVGSNPTLAPEVILLSAHMDHLGVHPEAPGADKIFNGADDDASGCIAVLELARVLAQGPRPKRTVYFAFFGSEEAGGYGAQYFVDNLPFPKDKLVANLEFEMIGRPDDKVKPDELWLTGYERSNLGLELARRGAKLVQDPHPDQNFFQRSDNYTLARQGIIAHTVSSFGLHKDYHQASDEIKTIDFSHMTRSINSMVAPIQWLVNTNFKPQWNAGQKP